LVGFDSESHLAMRLLAIVLVWDDMRLRQLARWHHRVLAMRSIILVHVHCKHGVLDVSDWAIGLYATPLLQRAPRLIHRGCTRRVPAGRKRRIGESGTCRARSTAFLQGDP